MVKGDAGTSFSHNTQEARKLGIPSLVNTNENSKFTGYRLDADDLRLITKYSKMEVAQ